jgi:quercetin dioxygenase-like cupin family protein
MLSHGAVERITDEQGGLIALVLRGTADAEETTFVTPPEAGLQVGLVVYPAGGEVPRHTHRPIERHHIGTPEVLVVRKGRCIADLYDDDRNPLTSVEIAGGDVIVLLSGGHGFRMIEDTVLLEVKQGPYPGRDEKDRF